VEAGQGLVVIDADAARAALDEAEATATEARARLDQVRDESVAIASEQERQARVSAEQAERALERAEYLHGLGGIPQTELESAQQAYDLARSRVAEAATRAEGTRASDVELAEARLQQAVANVDAARDTLERTVVRAPADGVVIDRRVDPGAAVQAGATLIEMVTSGRTQLVVEPDESNLALLEVGQRAIASAEAFPERTFAARVVWIAPSVDPERGTIEARLDVADPPAYLRLDMTVSVEIVTGRAEHALVVPRAAVRDLSSGTPWVLVVEEGRTARREVELGLRGEDVIEVREGLREGELAVASDAVGPSQRVRAVREA
jgi:HlyD family secretion protein